MKRKIGFIDLFIDEWHANNYPRWIRESSLKDEFDVAMAWQKETRSDLLSLEEWCKKFEVAPASSLEEIVEKCDCLCVLAPSNPEVHEELAELALKSGKPTYVDKPFATDRAAARRMFDLALRYKTPLMSSSALRYSDELIACQDDFIAPLFVSTCGGGRNFPEYAIHQIEMIVALLGTGALNVQLCGNKDHLSIAVRYPDRRLGSINYAANWGFRMNAANETTGIQFDTVTHIFENLLENILTFFKTGVSHIPQEETIEIAAILGACIKAMDDPEKWIPVE